MALSASACSLTLDSAPSEAQVEHFHRMLDEAHYDKLWSESSEALHRLSSQEEFVKLLRAVHEKLGGVQEAHKEGTQYSAGTSGSRIALNYRTRFAEGEAQETFVFDVGGEKPILIGYHVNSNDLITK